MKYCSHRWILSMIGMWLVCTSCNEPVIENQSEETEGRPSIINPDEGDGISEESNTHQKFPNYFKEGTRWNFLVDNIYTGQSYKTYYLEGKVQIGDKECCQYLSINEDDPNSIRSLGYISTEGDKVYIHLDQNDEEGALFYDFGMNIGDSVDVAAIYNTNTIKYDNYKYLSKKTIVSCGHTYEVHEMWATEESTYTPEEFCYGDLAQWICGLGEMIYLMPYGNTGHGLGIVGGEGMSLLSVEANGETIFDCNDVTETYEQ